jgi:hypothetical protein
VYTVSVGARSIAENPSTSIFYRTDTKDATGRLWTSDIGLLKSKIQWRGDRMEKLLLKVSEAAVICGVSRSSGYELAHSEWRSFTVRVGKSLRVVRSGLEEWVETKREEAALGSQPGNLGN